MYKAYVGGMSFTWQASDAWQGFVLPDRSQFQPNLSPNRRASFCTVMRRINCLDISTHATEQNDRNCALRISSRRLCFRLFEFGLDQPHVWPFSALAKPDSELSQRSQSSSSLSRGKHIDFAGILYMYV